MVRQILICALAVGVVALPLALTSRNDALWRSDTAPSTHAASQPHQARARARAPVTPTREAAPPAVASIPPAAMAPRAVPGQTQSQSAPDSAPAADDGEAESGKMIDQRDRGTERSARSH